MNDNIQLQILEMLQKTANTDSVEIGNSKTGVVKVYFNADAKEDARKKIQNAVELLEEAREKVYKTGGEKL